MTAFSNAAPEDEARSRVQAKTLFSQGNWKEALEIFRKLAVSSTSNPNRVAEDLNEAVQCLNRLGLTEEVDELLKKSVAAHPGNPRLLHQAAKEIQSVAHYGLVSNNAFHRAPHNRNSGVWVEVADLDRNQALRWMLQARQAMTKSDIQPNATDFYRHLTHLILFQRDGRRAWMLQDQTDLSGELNYADSEGNPSNQVTRYAPVDAESNPIFYSKPAQWEDAKSDGERFRWAVEKWHETQPAEAKLYWADFLNGQFGVATLAENRWFQRFQTNVDDDKKKQDAKTGVYEIHTLDDTEAIAQLADGIRRFTPGAEFNPLSQFRELIDKYSDVNAYHRLIGEYCNRRQYAKAAELCRQAVAKHPSDTTFPTLLDSIVLPRCRFDTVESQAAGRPATVGMVFRNAKQAEFTAHRVDMEKFFTDLKSFYRTQRPNERANFGGRKNHYPPSIEHPHDLFSDLKIENYLAGKQAEWKLDLQPLDNHWERRINVATPLQQAGLYVVTTKLDGGFTARSLVWINDTAIVRKQLDQKLMYHVADARTGLPKPNADVEFFGFNYEYSPEGRPKPATIASFAKKTNADGQVLLDGNELSTNMQWIVVARSSEGGFAPLGFEHLWFGQFYDQTFQQLKAFGVSDRPAYRPGETMKTKFWVALAKYGVTPGDERSSAPQAGQTYQLRLIDPAGTNLWKGSIETDRYGGASLEIPIPKDAKLGVYRFLVNEGSIQTELAVRIEEYRKPEFEVFIDAPNDPVQLGDKFKAEIRAKYYFGTPVAGAKATIKVTRSAFKDEYFPVRPFDWCYGPGYWWITYDAPWYPGWRSWVGFCCPSPWWMPMNPEEPPELVYEKEVLLDDAGKAFVEIDTAVAKAFQSDQDHRYRIEVDVRDASRRTLSSSGQVVAARSPFKIYSWNHRGFYQTGEKIVTHFQAKTLGGKSVTAKGKLELLRIAYDDKRQPIETLVQAWDAATNEDGELEHAFQAGRTGQYRLKLTLTDAAGHQVEGGNLVTIRGDDAKGGDFRFSAIELIPDKSEYEPGEKVKLQINADRDDAMVALFVRPQNGVYPAPRMIRLQAKSSVIEIPIEEADQPNFFIEAYTVYDGRFHQETREIFVPPQKRVLDVEVTSDKKEYLPGEEAEVTIQVKGLDGKPIPSSTVLAVYDRSLEQIAPDVLPPDIREFFWKWRRAHHPQSRENLSRKMWPIHIAGMPSAMPLGIFGSSMADDVDLQKDKSGLAGNRMEMAPMAAVMDGVVGGTALGATLMSTVRAQSRMMQNESAAMMKAAPGAPPAEGEAAANVPPPTVRKDFADAAYWQADLRGDTNGRSVAKFKMPENLTSWQIAVWSMSDGVRVGSGKLQAVTRKNLMVRLQTPRFLVDRDQVVVSALVNNDFPDPIEVAVELQQEGDNIAIGSDSKQNVTIPANGQKRIDWKCRAVKTGEATLKVTAVSTRESDAMQLKLPIIVNGILKTESFAGTLRPNQNSSQISFTVPEARIEDQSRLTVRVSPSLAMAMIDALPFLVDYPHGCTEQTLNRFVPTIVTHHTLKRMGIDLESLKTERNNLNAQELGDPAKRAERWKRFDRNPVFDNAEVAKMVEVGIRRLTEMQNSDGGWGWFSGHGEQSWPHTTAVVVRGLMTAKSTDAAIVPDCLQRGLDWLANYQAEQLKMLNNAATETRPYKTQPDDLDALVFHILVAADRNSPEMQRHLYEKRVNLSVQAKALLALATHRLGEAEQTAMLRRNIEQFLVEDAENETAYLQDQSPWWYWYGGTIESTASYLQLLTRLEPKGPTAPRLVKYLLNNRRHATYWNSTRDTAQVVEAFADYLAATGEGSGEMNVDVVLDGKSIGRVAFTPKTLFTTINTVELIGADVPVGKHTLEFRREGTGPLYWNVYQTNFTLEEEIAPAGLEVKINRRYYRLDPTKKELLKAGDRGQIEDGKRAGYDRVPIEDLKELKSGQMVEVELLIDSKNDYEYLMIQDPKAASMEPIETASGYTYNAGLGVYREFRDRYVGFFVRSLPRGNHSLTYRVRCEAPGRYTALPATAVGMYAPELVGNSADFDVAIVDE